MARFIVRRLLWMIPIDLHRDVPGVRRLPDRLEPGRQLFQGQPAGEPRRRSTQFIEDNGLYPGFRGYIRGYFEWLGQVPPRPRRLAEEHPGQRRGVGAAALLVLQHAAPRRHRRRPRHRHRRRRRHPRQPQARWLARHLRQHHGVLRRRHPAVRLGRHPAAGLRRPARMAPGRRCVPARPPRLRPGRDDQAHDPSRHRRGDPDDRPVLPVHAGVGARRVVVRLPPYGTRRRASPSARVLLQATASATR